MEAKNTVVSPCKPIVPPVQETIPEYLLYKSESFARAGKSFFLVDGISNEKRYFKDFELETRKVASHFYKEGLRKGDIVTYLGSYQIKQVLLMTGVWRANGVIRCLYSEEDEETIFSKIQESKSRWIFCDSEGAMMCKNVSKRLDWSIRIVIIHESTHEHGQSTFEEYLNDDGIECPDLTITANELAFILPTSGTTGLSKGAMHSHKSTLMQILTFDRLPWALDKPNVIASKGTHISGAIFPLCMLSAGLVGIVLHKINSSILIESVDKYKPGLVFSFPSFIFALGSSEAQDNFDVSSVEGIATGGCTITPAMKNAFLAIPSVKTAITSYGLTEGASIATIADMSEDRISPTYTDAPDSSIGKPYPGVSVQIRDLDTMEILGPNQKGEICFKADLMFTGYFLNQKSTKDSLIDGWFLTGDVGYYNEDGYIFIEDRKKDIFKCYASHISPTELENAISKHPLVKEVCVVGIKNSRAGEVPRAFVTLKEDKNSYNLTISEEIKRFAEGQLAEYKHLLGGLYILNDLPKGKTGKVTRSLLVQLKV